MGSTAGFHANQLDPQICREVQQLLTRKLLAHHNFAALVKAHQMKNRLSQINTNRVNLHGMPPPFTSLYPVLQV